MKNSAIIVGIIGVVVAALALPAPVAQGSSCSFVSAGKTYYVKVLRIYCEFAISWAQKLASQPNPGGFEKVSGGPPDWNCTSQAGQPSNVQVGGCTKGEQYFGWSLIDTGDPLDGPTAPPPRERPKPKPDEPFAVAKIIQIKSIDASNRTMLQYYRPPDDKWYTAYESMDIRVGDKFKTDGNTIAALEFVIGGRVGINKSSVIEIVGEGTVKENGKPRVKRIVIRQGGMWAKVGKRTDPLEIQTNGGVMGIKG